MTADRAVDPQPEAYRLCWRSSAASLPTSMSARIAAVADVCRVRRWSSRGGFVLLLGSDYR
jgi:hypothetical protein